MIDASLFPAWSKDNLGVFVSPEIVTAQSVTDELPADGCIQWLQCAHCKNKVARTTARIEVNGLHEHSFVNPMGVIYRISCFGSAPGALEVGVASDQFTWFQGYVWCVLICSGCTQHLGWSFTSRDARFCGLVLNQLKEP
jgi:hypothetical protein